MATSSKEIKFWRGTRASYNKIGSWDAYTHYTVKEADGSWSSFYGLKILTQLPGQLPPVISVVNSLSEVQSTSSQGDRYLIGPLNISGKTEYNIVEIGPNNSVAEQISIGDRSVRIKDRGSKEYQIINGELKTYDDVDCGNY